MSMCMYGKKLAIFDNRYFLLRNVNIYYSLTKSDEYTHFYILRNEEGSKSFVQSPSEVH